MRGRAALVLVLAWSAVAAGSPRRCLGRCSAALAAEVTIGALQMSLSDRHFSGSGQPAGVDGNAIGSPQSLAADGRTLGLVRPIMTEFQVHYSWLTPWHVALGGVLGGVDGSADRAQVDSLAGQKLGSSISGTLFGPEIAVVVAHGPLELRASLAGGYRRVGLPVTSFVKVSCGKGGRCYPTLDDDQFFLQPRATLAVHLRWFTIGGYAGGDLTSGAGWSAGGLVGVALPGWLARAEIYPPSP